MSSLAKPTGDKSMMATSVITHTSLNSLSLARDDSNKAKSYHAWVHENEHCYDNSSIKSDSGYSSHRSHSHYSFAHITYKNKNNKTDIAATLPQTPNENKNYRQPPVAGDDRTTQADTSGDRTCGSQNRRRQLCDRRVQVLVIKLTLRKIEKVYLLVYIFMPHLNIKKKKYILNKF